MAKVGSQETPGVTSKFGLGILNEAGQRLIEFCPTERCHFHFTGHLKYSWRRKRQPTPVFLPGKSHGQRSLVHYSPWVAKESDTRASYCDDEGNTWFFSKTLLAFSLLHSVLQSQICLLLLVFLRRGEGHPTSVLLPGKSHGRRSLVGCSPCGR